jgi:arylsulfatase A-like enzyme
MTTPRARVAFVVLLLALLGGGGWFALRPERARRPDIVLVVWDTCRADRLSAYGYPKDTSPWLKSFAADAVLFREAYTPSPWTPPAHGSLFTGLIPRNHGLLQGLGDRIAPGIPTLAETLRKAGYETVCFTANGFISGVTGLDAGFDRVVPMYEAARVARANTVVDAVDAWLRERRDARRGVRKPLFLFVNFMDLHLPRTPPPELALAMAGLAGPTPELGHALMLDPAEAVAHVIGVNRIDEGTLRALGPVYDASAKFLDECTGRLAASLEADGILPDAFFAVVGDHGEHLGEHGKVSHEMSLYDPVLRIPMVVRWPGRLDGGRQESAQVRLQDLHPTILEAAGVPVPPGTGKDALPLTASPLQSRLLNASFHRPTAFLPGARKSFEGANPAVFEKFLVSIHGVQEPADSPRPRKFLLYARRDGEAPPVTLKEELFDRAVDPGDSSDLLQDTAPEEAADVERLRGRIIR